MEFFCSFFYLVGEELLEVVEFSRIHDFMSGALNSTFITPVPKLDKLES